MESVQNLANSALHSIASVQLIAVAAAAGLFMRKYEQIVYITLGALVVNQLVTVVRTLIDGADVTTTVSGKWQSFLSLPMQGFLAAFIAFAVVESVAYGLKSLAKKHT
jgi:hypothetical protein